MLSGRKQKLYILAMVSVLALILLTAALLTACNDNKNGNEEDDTNNVLLPLSEYTIVRGDSSGNPVLKAALDLRASIRTQSGNDLPLTTDFTPDEGKHEILVGPTNREESIQVAQELDDSVRFIIRAVGNKIVILANTKNNLSAAVTYFTENFLKRKTDSIANIHHIEKNTSLILACREEKCVFVIPDEADQNFAVCVKSMIETLGTDSVTLLRHSQYEDGAAVMIGRMPEDSLSVSYDNFMGEDNYIARSAAGRVYLQGETELLTLTALGDFLYDLQKMADRDLTGSRHFSISGDYSFNRSWEFSVPKPIQATLDNSENISSYTYLFYYSDVSEYAFSLFKQMLGYLGYAPDPHNSDLYIYMETKSLQIEYQPQDQTLSVFLTSYAEQ